MRNFKKGSNILTKSIWHHTATMAPKTYLPKNGTAWLKRYRRKSGHDCIVVYNQLWTTKNHWLYPTLHASRTKVLVKSFSISDEVISSRFSVKPFQLNLWLTIALVTFLIGVLLWFFSTSSPFRFYGRCIQIAHHKERREHQKRRHTLHLTNSLWSSLVRWTVRMRGLLASSAGFWKSHRSSLVVRKIFDHHFNVHCKLGCVFHN